MPDPVGRLRLSVSLEADVFGHESGVTVPRTNFGLSPRGDSGPKTSIPLRQIGYHPHGRSMNSEWQARRRARLARDPRFDGKFFVGIVTTRIYCRPSCPVPTVNDKNVRYFSRRRSS